MQKNSLLSKCKELMDTLNSYNRGSVKALSIKRETLLSTLTELHEVLSIEVSQCEEQITGFQSISEYYGRCIRVRSVTEALFDLLGSYEQSVLALGEVNPEIHGLIQVLRDYKEISHKLSSRLYKCSDTALSTFATVHGAIVSDELN